MKRALVVGASSGIGRAIAEALLARGDRVVACGRRAGALGSITGAVPLVCNVASHVDRAGLVARAAAALGGLDALVYSAGIVRHEPLGSIDDEGLYAQLETNLVAPLRLGEEGLEVLDEGSSMLFLGSTLGHKPIATSAVYSATKAALLSVVRSLALAGAHMRIRVNAVSPGVVDTPMVRALRDPPCAGATRDEALEKQLDSLASLHPLERLGEPSEIAEAALHLLDAPWTTGSDLVVDGGLSLR